MVRWKILGQRGANPAVKNIAPNHHLRTNSALYPEATTLSYSARTPVAHGRPPKHTTHAQVT
jgi:hypothetical protein